MPKFIGTVADVASGEIEVGYASVRMLMSDSEIYGKADIISCPVDIFQLKVEAASGGRVCVSKANVEFAISLLNNDSFYRSVHSNVRDRKKMIIRRVENFESGSILSVS